MCSWFIFHGQTGLNHSRPKTRLERLTSANGCLVVFLGYFVNPVTSSNRKEKNTKGLGDPVNLILLGWWLQPFPHASITSAVPRAALWVCFPLLALQQLPWRAWKLLELQFRGCWLMPVSPPTSACHSHSNIASLLSRQETRAEGNTEDPCGSVCRSPVCVKFANNSPREDSRAFSSLWGLVWKFSWENWPLSPPPMWCPVSLEDVQGILHSVRRYSPPIHWICWNVSGRTAELVFLARRGMLYVAGAQPEWIARYCTSTLRHEPGRRDLAAKRALQQGGILLRTLKYSFSPEVSDSFLPFSGMLVACSAQSGI